MAIYYRKLDNHIVVSGKTYPYRDLIKGFGGRFNPANKVWQIPQNDESLRAIHDLCKSVGGGPLQIPQDEAPRTMVAETGLEQSNAITSVKSETIPTEDEPLAIDSSLGITVQELMQKAHLALQAAFPRALWIIGEIQNFNPRNNGIFFQLADFKEGASKSATMTISSTLWTNQLKGLIQKLGKETLDGILQDGMRIRALAQVNFYRDRGSLTLNILDLDPRFTKGALALAREELLKELRQKGLDRKNPSTSLSPFPLKVGLITADNSRAKSDFLHQLFSYGFCGEVVFYPCQMQGEKTLEEVCRGIEKLSKASCDLIVVTRGGGSLADLRWFDSREIAFTIANCPIPIIAAIGHHEDVCVAEEIAYRREKTPTAAADYILGIFQATRDRMKQSTQYLLRALSERLNQSQNQWAHLREKLGLTTNQALNRSQERVQKQIFVLQQATVDRLNRADKQLQNYSYLMQKVMISASSRQNRQVVQLVHTLHLKVSQRLMTIHLAWERLPHKLVQESLNKTRRQQEILSQIENKLAESNPRPWLSRGWTQLHLNDGKSIKSIHQVKPGDTMHARIQDGQLTLKVDRIESRK